MRTSLFRGITGSLSLIATALLCSSAEAATFILASGEQGWFNQNGLTNRRVDGVATGNTFTGDFFVDETSPSNGEYRSFFIFDVSGLTEPIESANLTLFQEVYFSSASTEEVTLFGVDSSKEALETQFSGVSNIPIFDDLGSGPVYGTQTIAAAPTTQNSGTLVQEFVTFSLAQPAIDAINEARETDGFFAVGAALTTTGDSPYTAVSVSSGEALGTSESISFSSGAPDGCRGILSVSETSNIADFSVPCLEGGEALPQRPIIVDEKPMSVPEPGIVLGAALAIGTGISLKRSKAIS